LIGAAVILLRLMSLPGIYGAGLKRPPGAGDHCRSGNLAILIPPPRFALFYLKGVCPPEIEDMEIDKGLAPLSYRSALVWR
jgi:TRAP-type mannitol/chloroaromatic compound transport system permease large subunit